VLNNRIATAPLILVVAALAGCRSAAPAADTLPPAPAARPTPPESGATAPLKLGLILPESASADVAEYGSLVREGVDLALAQYASTARRRIDLLVRDDSGKPASVARAVADLERDGAVAILGPLSSDGVEAAAAGRSNSDVVILSPTASEIPPNAVHAYSLNSSDARSGPELARWAVASGMLRLGVLYATTPESSAEARTFSDAAVALGSRIVVQLPFDPGTTTFSSPIERLKAAAPQAVFVAASERDIRQLAPQFAYFGLTNIQILGPEAWVSPEVLKAVPARVLEGVVAATPLIEGGGDETGWNDFVQLYERTHRRTLDNPYPALGFDAANLVLNEIAAGRTRPRDVADAVANVSNYRGATGVLSVQDGRISRRPFLVRITSGRPQPIVSRSQ
jgi:branched-chain amino acid transport system substrate-binding protein